MLSSAFNSTDVLGEPQFPNYRVSLSNRISQALSGMLKNLFHIFLNRKLTKDQFAHRLVKTAREKGFNGPLDDCPNELRIQHGDNGYLNLHNPFDEYQGADGADRRQVANYVALFINGLPTSSHNFAYTNPLLRPVIATLLLMKKFACTRFGLVVGTLLSK